MNSGMFFTTQARASSRAVLSLATDEDRSSSSTSNWSCLSLTASSLRSVWSALPAFSDHLMRSGAITIAESNVSAACSKPAFDASATFSAAAFTAGTILRNFPLMSASSNACAGNPSKPTQCDLS